MSRTLRSGARMALTLLAWLAVAPASAQVIGPVCLATFDPLPSGVTSRPVAPFTAQDHPYLHSSTHLQGVRAEEKWAGGLIYAPPASTGFNGFTSGVLVNNPDPFQAVFVQVDFHDHAGAITGTVFQGIGAEGTQWFPANSLAGSFGVGSARVRVLDGPPIVGATVLHTRCAFNVCDQDLPMPTPGASSMQQLQVVQDTKTELWWGPLPLTTVSAVDFFNFHAPFLSVVNPNNAPNTVRVDLVAFDRTTGTVTPFNWRTLTLPPFGTLLEVAGPHLPGNGLWNQFILWYGQLTNPDFDFLVHVTSEDGLPILGDGVMTDFAGDSEPRFRMASHMLANTPTWRLYDPDFSFEPGFVHTYIGLFNTGTADAGPLRVQYYDRNGTLVGTSNVASLPPNRSVRIEPGFPGYPGPTGYGWVRISACTGSARVVGWTVREILQSPFVFPHYHKAFGETLDGLNGAEPGGGWDAALLDGTVWRRKVSPLVRTMPSWYWPGYTTFANTAVSNVGPYWFRFHDFNGGNCTGGAQPFAGVRWGNTSTTLEDPESVCFGNLSGRVDVTTGPVRGIDVIGDPLIEYGLPCLASPCAAGEEVAPFE